MLLIGLDIGTSATKAIVINDGGEVVAQASASYPLHQPQPGWSEQDPMDWWNASIACIRRVLQAPGVSAAAVEGIGLSGQMHGSVLLDEAGIPVRRALLWNDQRTAAECAEIEKAAGGRAALVAEVGNAALTGFTLPKLLWVRKHEPAVWARVRRVMLPKDFVSFMLTGERATDVGDASGTLLFDIDKRTWSKRALVQSAIDPALLPRALESTTTVGGVTSKAASATGLAAGTPVIIGSGDNMTGAVGAGVVEPGMVLASLGTSGVIYTHLAAPGRDLADPEQPGRLHTMCAAVPGAWCMTGCTLSAGGALRWCRDTIAPGTPYDTLMAEAASAPPGCAGLVFLPYLTGERCPHPDPQARGGWIGLTTRHTRAHLVRAVIEGVTFNMGEILDLMRSVARSALVETVRVTGTGNRALVWRQMQADVYGAPVVSSNTDEGGCALGAALLAGVGVGAWPSVAAACLTAVKVTETLDPDSSAHERYGPAREVFAGLYADLRHRFARLEGAG